MRRLLPLLLAALAGCAVKAGAAGNECTFATDKSRADFCAAARDLGARAERDKDGLHIQLNGEAGSVSSFAKALIARESTCCPHLHIRYEQTDEINVLHVSADKDHGPDLDRLEKLFQAR